MVVIQNDDLEDKLDDELGEFKDDDKLEGFDISGDDAEGLAGESDKDSVGSGDDSE